MARILVIEENRAVADVLRELLENEGSYVVVAPDPTAWSTGPFDLAIVGLTSPTDPTISDLREVSRSSAGLKIIGLVADSRPDYDLTRTDSVLRKPFEMRELLDTVRRLSSDPVH